MSEHAVKLSAAQVSALAKDLEALRKGAMAEAGEEDLAHLRKMRLWTAASTGVGLATAWIAPNPISAFFLSLGTFGRWTSIAHPISHRGYDKVPGVPAASTSKVFAQGWRRFVDWFDWILPAAWHEEHDLLHHYSLGESRDPDRVETNTEWLRSSKWPMPVRYVIVAFFAMTWKWLYYAPNTLQQLSAARARRSGLPHSEGTSLLNARFVNPADPLARDLWLRCILPYATVKFVLVPAAFYAVSPWAAFSVLANQILAELMTNVHAFLTIVPNHAGEDLYQFEGPIEERDEFFARQILGSVNYRCGSDVGDFLQGWLNYQIEHHLWPAMPLLRYQRLQPEVKRLCEAHGVPYKQESIWTRVRKTVDVMVGKTSQPVWALTPTETGEKPLPGLVPDHV